MNIKKYKINSNPSISKQKTNNILRFINKEISKSNKRTKNNINNNIPIKSKKNSNNNIKYSNNLNNTNKM
jgi:hypothetical protein